MGLIEFIEVYGVKPNEPKKKFIEFIELIEVYGVKPNEPK